MKKLISVLLAVLMLTALCVPAFASGEFGGDDLGDADFPWDVPGTAGQGYPDVNFTEDLSGVIVENADGLYIRVAEVISLHGETGLLIFQGMADENGFVPIQVPAIPGMELIAANVALVPTLADIQSSNPDFYVMASAKYASLLPDWIRVLTPEEIAGLLTQLDPEQVAAWIEEKTPDEVREFLSLMVDEYLPALLPYLDPVVLVDWFYSLTPEKIDELLDKLDPGTVAYLLPYIDTDVVLGWLESLPTEKLSEIIASMDIPAIQGLLIDLDAEELQEFFSRLDPSVLLSLLPELDPEFLEELLENFDPEALSGLIPAVDPAAVAEWVQNIDPAELGYWIVKLLSPYLSASGEPSGEASGEAGLGYWLVKIASVGENGEEVLNYWLVKLSNPETRESLQNELGYWLVHLVNPTAEAGGELGEGSGLSYWIVKNSGLERLEIAEGYLSDLREAVQQNLDSENSPYLLQGTVDTVMSWLGALRLE